eukprot:1158544-Pelagomonas_calceolata.AAC.2
MQTGNVCTPATPARLPQGWSWKDIRSVKMRNPNAQDDEGAGLFTKALCSSRASGLRFGLLSGSLFVGFHCLFSHMYGEKYTQEAFLHHLTRKDHRSVMMLRFRTCPHSFIVDDPMLSTKKASYLWPGVVPKAGPPFVWPTILPGPKSTSVHATSKPNMFLSQVLKVWHVEVLCVALRLICTHFGGTRWIFKLATND